MKFFSKSHKAKLGPKGALQGPALSFKLLVKNSSYLKKSRQKGRSKGLDINYANERNVKEVVGGG